MGKFFRILVLATLAIGLIVGSASAGSLATTSKTVAAELILAATDLLPATANPPISYRPEVDMTAGATFKMTITNGKFNTYAGANIYALCSGATMLAGTGTVAAATDNVTFTVAAAQSLSANTLYAVYADTAGTGTPCAVGGVTTIPVLVNKATLGGSTVTVAVTASTVAGATSGSATLYSVVNEFTATLLPVTSKLAFADNMETFVVTGTALPYTPSATQSQAGIVLIGNAALDNGVAITTVGVCTNTLAATEQIDFKITGNLTGISQINYDNGAAGRTYTVLAADRTAGFATLSVTGANLLICKATETATAKALELQAANVTGTPIVTGARTVTVTLLKKTAVSAADRALIAAGTTSHTFTLDGSQYYIPLVGSSTGRETYIKLQSKSLVAGSNGVTIAILDNLGGITATWTGQIQPGIPLTISGADLVAAAATAGKTVSGSAGFAVIVTVNAPETDVFAYANMIDASGAKRIPVKTVNGVISE